MFEAPVYTRFYIVSKDGDIPVHFPDFSGEKSGYDVKLKEVGDLREIYYTRTKSDGTEVERQRTIYVEVEHDLEHPIAEWDCRETGEMDERYDMEPRKFCEAAIVATPKAALV